MSENHEFKAGDRVVMFGKITTAGVGGHEWRVLVDAEGVALPAVWLPREALFHARPSDATQALADRLAAAEAQVAAVRGVLNLTRKLTPEVSAMCGQLVRALNGERP